MYTLIDSSNLSLKECPICSKTLYGPSICYANLQLGRLLFQCFVVTQTLLLTLKSIAQRYLFAYIAYRSCNRAMFPCATLQDSCSRSTNFLASIQFSFSFSVLALIGVSQSNDIRGSYPFLVKNNDQIVVLCYREACQ